MLALSATTSVTALQPTDHAPPTTRRRLKVVPVTRPLPMHHATKAMHVEWARRHDATPERASSLPGGWTARVLFLRKPDGSVEAYAPLVVYMTDYWSRSATWQDTLARGVGLLWDFFRAHSPAHTAATEGQPWRRSIFRAFALALVTGTINPDTKHDPLGLFWPHMPRSRATMLLRSVEDFVGWYHAVWLDGATVNRDSIVNPKLPEDSLTFTEILVWSRLKQASMLAHLKSPKKITRQPSYDVGLDPKGSAVQPVKFFPPDRAADLVFEGHRRPSRRGMQPTNVRDQMIALLCGWGGLRRSEAFHLWVNDVTLDPDRPDCGLVALHHPSEAKVTYKDAFAAEVTMTRKEYLNREFGLEPRHLVTRGRYHAGWKGLELDGSLRSNVHWLDEDAGAVFYRLYSVYVRDRATIMDLRKRVHGFAHPFLFVSEGSARQDDGSARIGDPYSMKAYERNHRAAVKRLGLTHGRINGTATHGLRHAYGQSLMDLGLAAPVIKKAMHHRSYLSQAVYTAPTDAKVDRILNAAKKKVETEGTTFFDLPGSEDSLALYRLSEHINSGGSLG